MIDKKYVANALIITVFIFISNIMARASDTCFTPQEKRDFQRVEKNTERISQSRLQGRLEDFSSYKVFADSFIEKWRNGNPDFYASLVEMISRPLVEGPFNDNRRFKLARMYIISALQKPDDISIWKELRLLNWLPSLAFDTLAIQSPDFATERTVDTEIMLHAWKRLLEGVDPDWDPYQLTQFEEKGPPTAEGYPIGTDPRNIQDRTLRKKYEKELKLYNDELKRIKIKYSYHDCMSWFPTYAEVQITREYTYPPENIEELTNLLNRQLPDKNAKARIIAAVKDKRMNNRGNLAQIIQWGNSDEEKDAKRLTALTDSLRNGNAITLDEYLRFGDSLIQKWHGRDWEYYANIMMQICDALERYYETDARASGLLRKYALTALAEADSIPIYPELDLIRYITLNVYDSNVISDKDFVQKRVEEVSVRLHAWRRLLEGIDWNWHQNLLDRRSSVWPPSAMAAGNPMWISGMGSEAIIDSIIRSEYEEMIILNSEKLKKHQEQREYHEAIEDFPEYNEYQIIGLYSRPPFNVEQLKQLLDNQVPDNRIKNRIIRTVEKNIERWPNIIEE